MSNKLCKRVIAFSYQNEETIKKNNYNLVCTNENEYKSTSLFIAQPLSTTLSSFSLSSVFNCISRHITILFQTLVLLLLPKQETAEETEI